MDRIPVVLLGLYDTGLYVAQSLAKYNVPVIGFDYKPSNPGFYSRYIKSYLGYHPVQQPKELLQQIKEKALEISLSKPILIPSSEDYLGFIAQYRGELQKFYDFILPEKQIIKNIISKEGQFEMARKINIPVYDFWCIKNSNDFDLFLHQYDNSKVIIKALDQTEWKTKSNQKAYMANNLDDLLSIGKFLAGHKLSFIIQKIIDGECTNNYEFNALMINGNIVESCIIQKIRQYPPSFGAACCIQTCNNAIIEEIGRSFVIKNRIDGFSNTEFKLNPIDGKYYFIETNARVWLQIRLTEYLGKNFLLRYYNHLTSNKQMQFIRKNIQVKWVDIFSDFVLWWRYLRKEGFSLRSYLTSLRGTRYYGLLNLSDLKPFLHELKEMNIFKFRNKQS